MKFGLFVGAAVALALVHQSGLVPRRARVRPGRLSALLDPGSIHVFDGEVPAWARLLHPSRVWLRWRGTPRGAPASRVLCGEPADLPVAERFVRDEGWLADVCLEGTPPPEGPLVSLFMGRLPARTGGEAYDVEVARELMRRGCRVEYRWVSLLTLGLQARAGPLLRLLLAGRPGLFLVDEHFLAPLRLANARRRGRLAVIVHHMEGERGGRGALLARADAVIVVSASTRDQVAALGVRPDRLALVPPGFHAESLAATSPPRALAREFLFVGTLTPRKGVVHLLQAWARLPRGRARLRVVGGSDGSYRARVLEPLARRLGLRDEVRFEGRVPRDRLAALYADSDVLVLPSLQEGFGIVALEAMHCGLAVVASRVDSLPELVEDGVTGLLAAPADPEDLAGAMRRLLDEPGLRARLGREGRARADARSWERTRAAFWEVVGPLVEESPARSGSRDL